MAVSVRGQEGALFKCFVLVGEVLKDPGWIRK